MASNRKRGNGDGTIYPYKGDRFRASLPLPDGSRRTKVFSTYSKAEAWLVEERSKRDSGITDWSPSRMPTLGQWWDLWLGLKEDRVKRRTMDSYRAVRDRYLSPSLLRKPLGSIAPVDIENLYGELRRRPKSGSRSGEVLSGATVHHVHRVLRACLKTAYKKGVIAHDPMSRVSPPPTRRGRNDWLSLPEAHAVMTVAKGDDLEALWLISLTLGPRQGESLALKWADIDWEKKTLTIERQVHRVKGDWIFEETKQGEGRTLPLDDHTLDALRRRRASQSAQRLKAGVAWRDFDLIFTTSRGTPIDERNDRANWYRLLDEAGVRRVRRHDARHTAGTLHYAQTKDAKHVQTMLGHADPYFTAAVYIHADTEFLRAGQASVAQQVCV